MESRLIKTIGLQHEPVAILFSDQKPPGALEGKEGVWNCIIPMLLAAAKGKTAVFSRKTTGCLGGAVGLGFGNSYEHFPGGFEYFLSTGRGEGYREGEAYKKTPELAKDFVSCLPMTEVPSEFLVFKPLSQVDQTVERPELVVFYVNPDQLSALTVLANYSREGIENAMIPFASGCQAVFLLPYKEAQRPKPRGVVGLVDITVRPMVGANMLSFTVPFSMFLEMEENIPGSFLTKHIWEKIMQRN